jgi:hypothetical protein
MLKIMRNYVKKHKAFSHGLLQTKIVLIGANSLTMLKVLWGNFARHGLIFSYSVIMGEVRIIFG